MSKVNAIADHEGASRLAIVDKKTHKVINLVRGSIAWAEQVYDAQHDHYFIDVGHPPDIGWSFDPTTGRFQAPTPEPAADA